MHPTGNFGKAMYGGRPRELQRTAPNAMRDIYLRILEDPPEDFEVSLEATHHSPTIFSVPMFFAEVGSREEQWRDRDVCNYLVECMLRGIEDEGDARVAIGFGGGHYCPYFSPKMREYAFGHIAAKYAIPLLSMDLVQQMVEKSGTAELAILDSGLKSNERRKVEGLLSRLDLDVI
jgi:D-aminoacyl-tRNA deacylase